MKLRILGPRLLVRLYEMPETTASGLIVPEAYRKMYDGYLYEVVAAADKVAERLCVFADKGDSVVVGLSGEFEAVPLVLREGDIIRTRDATPIHSPEMSAFYGYDVWFMDVVVTVQGKEKSVITEVWPAARWQEESEAA